MTSAAGWDSARATAHPRELDSDQCLILLIRHEIGRVAWMSSRGPELFPVSYAFDDGIVYFRTSPYGPMSQLVRPTEVVFEVDEVDPVRRAAWSVIVRGRTAAVPSPPSGTEQWPGWRALPWVSGSRNLIIGITVRQVTGRQIGRQNDEQ